MGGVKDMGWANWFSKAATDVADAPDASGAAALQQAHAGVAAAGDPAISQAGPAETVPYDEQVLQAGWVPAERVDGAAAEHPPAGVPGEDALQDALAFLARVYNNQGC